jgi:small subunit ribosomal protein S17
MEEITNNQETPVTEGAPVEEPFAAPAAAQTEKARGRRAEKIGIVTSDKMMKTVVVRVDRLVKHPIYKRYVRKRSKFMAHNEIEGVSIGDQVRIVETRPLSARKRWRVVEVVRKASK